MSDTSLVFGWRTALLTVAIVQLLVIAAALSRSFANRHANRLLALLLVVLAGIVTPWAIGFAGFYDRWRWLSFLPVSVPLAVAPLLYLYVATLVGEAPRRKPHLIAPLAQFGLLFASFLLPPNLKDRWFELASGPMNRTAAVGTIAGLIGYGIAGLRLLRRYRVTLADQRSDDQRFAARWLSRAIGASFVLLPVWAGFELWDWASPLGYRGLMGLHVAIAAFALYLAVEGWRHAALPYPVPAAPPATAMTERDWTRQGQAWAAKVRGEHWYLDPELSLADLARRLGTNANYVSRAINEGLGMNFSTFVNGLRCEAVAARLRAGDTTDLLLLALDAGFSAKASFNRAFLAAYGMSPSAYRAHVSKRE